MLSKILFSNAEKKILTLSQGELSPLYVCDMGWHKTPPLHTFGPAVRPYYLLHFIESGKGEIEREGKITPLAKGDAFLILPGEVTTYRADKDEPWTYRWISFAGDFAKELVEETTDLLSMKYRASGLQALRQALDDEICDKVNSLRVLLTALSSIQSVEKRTESLSEESVIATAIRYLEESYFRDIDVASLADSFGYSRAYFTTLFSKRTGKSPYRYLTYVRMEKAKEFLRATEHTVEEIAYSLGFSCVSRFSELFKKYTRLTPLQYRKSEKG